jgi:chromatin remodeling complex protein RSC6
MVRTTKSSVQSSSTSVPQVVSEVPSVPIEAAKAKKTPSAKKEKVAKVETEVATPAPVPVPTPAVVETASATEVVAEDSKTLTSDALLTGIDAKIQQVGSILASLKNESKALRRQLAQDRRTTEKLIKKTTKKKRVVVEGEEVKPRKSGFMCPVKISDELASFLGKETGTVMGRQDANDEIREYVKSNNLKETEKGKGRNINPDAKLSALLKLPSDVQLTYFNLQKYMKSHFIKIEAESSQ